MNLDKPLISFLKQHKVEEATPGLLLRAYHKGKTCLDVSYGKVFHFYDVASLTKVIFTVTRLMMLKEMGVFDENRKMKSVVPWFGHPHKSLKKFLNHTAGAIAWKPYFLKMPELSRAEKWTELQRQLRSEPSFQRKSSTGQAVYSDVGFLLLGVALEYLESCPLLQSWQKVQEAFDLTQTHFHVDNKPLKKVSCYAPTEFCAWRKKQLQGQVSDENAYMLGGIAPHAGLFSTIEDTSRWILQLRAIFYGKDIKFLSQKVLKSFVNSRGEFALGFMKPSLPPAKDKIFTVPSCGRLFSRKSFGHTGFTGTSVWFDPQKDVIVVLLSNRVCPKRSHKKFLFLRPLIHEKIIQSLFPK